MPFLRFIEPLVKMKAQVLSWAAFTAIAFPVAVAPFPLIKDYSSFTDDPYVAGKWSSEASNDALSMGNLSASAIPSQFDTSSLRVQVTLRNPIIDFNKQDAVDAITGLRNSLRSKHPMSIIPSMQIYPTNPFNNVAAFIVPYSFATSALRYGDAVDVAVALLAYIQRWRIYRFLEFSIHKGNGDLIGKGGIIKARRSDQDYVVQFPREESVSLTQFISEFNETI